MKKVFQVFSDPGHGWVKVPISVLVALGIEQKITQFSYIKGDFAYLEEDCDASLFYDTYKKLNGVAPVFKTYHGNKESRIRNYQPYFCHAS